VELASVPASTEQFDALRRRLCQTPQGAAAALVAVMLACNEDRHAGMTFATMLLHTDRLRKGDLHRGMEPGQHFRDLLDIGRRKPYVARSYLLGATPGNGYTPAEPLRVRWKPHAHESSTPARRRILLHCSGADNPRPVTLRRASDGLWAVDEASSLFVGIRPPAS
jgi:hypothetical protein